MSHISLRIDTDLDERLDRYAERHHLENRSQAIRHALRSMLNLEEGETVALRPVAAKKPGSMKSKARKRVLKDVPLPGTGYSEAEDLKKGQGIIDRVTSQRRPKDTSGAPPAERVEDETEAEYFERIRVQNERQAQGVGPEPWS